MAETREGRAEEFKRVLSAAMKTIADDPELTVSFGNETPALSGNKARLPQVTRSLRTAAVAEPSRSSYAIRNAHEFTETRLDLRTCCGWAAPQPRSVGEALAHRTR